MVLCFPKQELGRRAFWKPRASQASNSTGKLNKTPPPLRPLELVPFAILPASRCSLLYADSVASRTPTPRKAGMNFWWSGVRFIQVAGR